MKLLCTIFISLILIGSSTFSKNTESQEYQIAGLALEHFQKFNLLEKPNNENILNYLNGFEYKSFPLNTKFAFSNHLTNKWNLTNSRWDKDLKEKINIIKNFDAVPKVSLSNHEKAEAYISLSNPAFSKGGDYAIIHANYFFNMIMTESYGYLLIFQKIRNRWSYIDKFETYKS
jgi:hypothetical protein